MDAASGSAFERGSHVLVTIFGLALVISVIHYVDNFVNYPVPGPGGPPTPSATVIAVSWFVFTAFGLVGMWLWFHRRTLGASAALAIYSISGLIGVGHYTVPGATQMVWWRQTHVIADILCGVAILLFAIWAISRRRMLSAPEA